MAAYADRVQTDARPSEKSIRAAEMLALMVPADAFEPFQIDFGTASDDEVFPLIVLLNRLNECVGGNGIEIETIEELPDDIE